MPHRQHSKATQFLLTHDENSVASHDKSPNLRRIEYHWGETGRHLRVQPDLYSCLNLIFCLDKRIEKFIGVDDRFAIIGHQADKGCVPLIHDLGEGRGARAHENLTDTIVELLNTCARSQHTATSAHTTAVQHLHPRRGGMPAPSAPSTVH